MENIFTFVSNHVIGQLNPPPPPQPFSNTQQKTFRTGYNITSKSNDFKLGWLLVYCLVCHVLMRELLLTWSYKSPVRLVIHRGHSPCPSQRGRLNLATISKNEGCTCPQTEIPYNSHQHSISASFSSDKKSSNNFVFRSSFLHHFSMIFCEGINKVVRLAARS